MHESRLYPDRGTSHARHHQLAGLRDADWARGVVSDQGRPESGQAQCLYRWDLGATPRATGLLFLPLDGNPRHGVLALLVEAGELFGAIEILERQGCWVVMPEPRRARAMAASALMCAGTRGVPCAPIAGTPDRRFVFFNTQREGVTITWVERRRDALPLLHDPSESH